MTPRQNGKGTTKWVLPTGKNRREQAGHETRDKKQLNCTEYVRQKRTFNT